MIALYEGDAMPEQLLTKNLHRELELPALENLPPLVLLSPRLPHFPRVLAELLGDRRYLYYSLPRPVENLTEFLVGLTESLRSVEGKYGVQMTSALSDKSDPRVDLS